VDSNALYYTLSTIAQTLAGALAVLLAVVLFRYTALLTVMEAAKVDLRVRNINVDKAWPILREGGVVALDKHLKEEQHYTSGFRGGGPGVTMEAAHRAYQDWGRINLRLYLVVGTAATDIAFCFLALPFTPRIGSTPWLARAVIAGTCGLGIVCMALFVWLIVGMVKRPAD